MKCPKCDADNTQDSQFCKKCATSLTGVAESQRPITKTIETPREELTTGSTFAGRYQIIEELGKGGMGKVYKALDTKINEKIALKLIKPEIASDKKIIERFSNELKLARKVGHRNVGRMFHLAEDDGTHYITMEYVSGEDLKSMIRMSGQLGIGTAINIAKQICEGLTEAHRMGVIHRDLKPSNIMIDKSGNARIMDFGIARSLRTKGLTGSGVMIGTPEYMSPEQVEAKEVDQRSDIYSLGVILYEMVTGRVPFDGDTPFSIGVKHKSEEPEDPLKYNSRIPGALSRVILKCLEKGKEGRYQSAAAVRSELELVEDNLPLTAHVVPHKKPLTSKEITVSFSPKSVIFPVLSIIAVIAIGIGVWQIFLKKDPVPYEVGKIAIAVLPFEDRSPLNDQAPICEQMMIDINRKFNQLGGFDARSRFLVKPLADTGKDPGTIGEELGVSTILVGSIQFDEENIDVEVELLGVGDRRTLWTNRILRTSDEIFTIQNEIVEKIANVLGLTLSSEESAMLNRKSTDSTAAYNQYALGLWFFDKRTSEGFEKAIGYYRQAIALDPEYALAYSGLADVYISQSPDKEAEEQARVFARKALDLDDTLAEAFTSRASVRLGLDWDFKGAEEDFKEALALNPKYATAHHWYSRLLTMFGHHEEAIAEMESALALNPTDLSINRNLVWTLICARQFDRALLQAKKTYNMDPEFSQVKELYFAVLVEKSMFREILELFNSDEDSGWVGAAMILMHAKNNREEAVKMFDDIAETVAGVQAAWIYARLEEADKVYAHLKRSYENRDYRMTFLKVTPVFEKYHSDPRFKALLKKMGLDE